MEYLETFDNLLARVQVSDEITLSFFLLMWSWKI